MNQDQFNAIGLVTIAGFASLVTNILSMKMRKGHASLNPVLDETIKTYEIALDDHRRGRYQKRTHEELKVKWKEAYDRGDIRIPEDPHWISYEKLPEDYNKGAAKCKRSKRRNISALEWSILGMPHMFFGDPLAGRIRYAPGHEGLGRLLERPIYTSNELFKDHVNRVTLAAFRAGLMGNNPEFTDNVMKLEEKVPSRCVFPPIYQLSN